MSVHSIETEVHDKAIHLIVPEGATAEQVAAGSGFTEGPVWCGDYPLLGDEAAGEDIGGGERLDICLDFRQNEK